MVVQHNMTAMNANRQLGITTGGQAKATEKLSSGYKINRAADDAAGLTISEKMRSQIRGLTQASANAQDGVSVVQTAEGALGEVHDMLQRMNELAVKASTATNTNDDRVAIEKEVNALVSEIGRVAQSTQFNTQNLLDGTFKGKSIQVGAENSAKQTIEINITKMTVSGLGLDDLHKGGIADDDGSLGKAAIDLVESAISKVSSMRSSLGAIQNRLEHTISNLDNIVENTTSAESAIRDTDMASTMVAYSKNNILMQAGQSMLAQANQANQGVLSLLQ
ncbi:MAG: flagellin [Lachnospiraceae bacterium]|nr:flagellin [Lachnospiraceae bacterium]